MARRLQPVSKSSTTHLDTSEITPDDDTIDNGVSDPKMENGGYRVRQRNKKLNYNFRKLWNDSGFGSVDPVQNVRKWKAEGEKDAEGHPFSEKLRKLADNLDREIDNLRHALNAAHEKFEKGKEEADRRWSEMEGLKEKYHIQSEQDQATIAKLLEEKKALAEKVEMVRKAIQAMQALRDMTDTLDD
ncbi:hypothetical protein CC80DRAFT_588538 [Byssothecium circinans]|uniref:Uncharacterized protein n=1 Tax=Byssothecium circinans TaxID=147558 RepID=A0A6A5UDS6_9PLEO|nr:hypothetical protein CC80DRAFT_588538 [Byssothecium circinans]